MKRSGACTFYKCCVCIHMHMLEGKNNNGRRKKAENLSCLKIISAEMHKYVTVKYNYYSCKPLLLPSVSSTLTTLILGFAFSFRYIVYTVHLTFRVISVRMSNIVSQFLEFTFTRSTKRKPVISFFEFF